MSYTLGFTQRSGNTQRLEPFPAIDLGFSTAGYVNDGGFASQQSVGSANFLIPSYSGPSPVFTRGSSGTFRNAAGLIERAPENLLTYSENFSNPVWSKAYVNTSGIPPYVNVAVAPNGTQTAEKLIENNQNAEHYINQFRTATNETVTFSVFAKSAGRNYVRLQLSNFVNSAVQASFYLYNDGSIVETPVNSSDYTGSSASIVSVGNGWYRCSLTTTKGSVNTANNPVIALFNGSSGVYQGDGTSGIYIWGAQLERHTSARPYISTTSAAVYGPRFEYATNGEPLGLLMEEQSTNLLIYSNEFTISPWVVQSGSISPAVGNAPDGSSTLKMFSNSGTSGNYYYLTTTSNAYHTLSVYAKKGNTDWVYMNFFVGSTNYLAWFNLNNGTVGTTDPTISASINYTGSGFYRIAITKLLQSAATYCTTAIPVNGDGLTTKPSNGTVYIWGAQLEAKPFATSYIPTVDGPATRNADVLSLPVGTWFNQDEGTVVVSGDRSHNPSLNSSNYDSFFEFSDDAGSYHNAHFSDGTSESFFVDAGSANVTYSGIAAIGALTGIAVSYSTYYSEIYISRDGLPTQSSSLVGISIYPSTLNIGYADALGNYWNGHIRSFRYFPKSIASNLQRYSDV